MLVWDQYFAVLGRESYLISTSKWLQSLALLLRVVLENLKFSPLLQAVLSLPTRLDFHYISKQAATSLLTWYGSHFSIAAIFVCSLDLSFCLASYSSWLWIQPGSNARWSTCTTSHSQWPHASKNIVWAATITLCNALTLWGRMQALCTVPLCNALALSAVRAHANTEVQYETLLICDKLCYDIIRTLYSSKMITFRA